MEKILIDRYEPEEAGYESMSALAQFLMPHPDIQEMQYIDGEGEPYTAYQYTWISGSTFDPNYMFISIDSMTRLRLQRSLAPIANAPRRLRRCQVRRMQAIVVRERKYLKRRLANEKRSINGRDKQVAD